MRKNQANNVFTINLNWYACGSNKLHEQGSLVLWLHAVRVSKLPRKLEKLCLLIKHNNNTQLSRRKEIKKQKQNFSLISNHHHTKKQTFLWTTCNNNNRAQNTFLQLQLHVLTQMSNTKSINHLQWMVQRTKHLNQTKHGMFTLLLL